MTSLSYLTDLAQHFEWADAAVWQAVLGSTEASRDSQIAKWLHHVHLVQTIFRQAWSGGPFQVPELTEFQDLQAMAAWGRDAHAQVQAFLATADEQQVERELRLPWADQIAQTWNRPAHHPTMGESVVQLALHTAHHRGQVCARLRELGGDPPLIDFIAWVWQARPGADWSFLSVQTPGAAAL